MLESTLGSRSDDAGGDGRATCLGCGCACDDIEVVVEAGRILEARRACDRGVAWFGDGAVPADVRVDGREATMDDALDAAVRLLSGAVRPLVYLAPDVSCETQRAAVAVADALRATIDSVTSAEVLRSVLAGQERGRATATLGEVRNRADLIVYWGVDPAERYPRFSERCVPDAPGLHVPEGRPSRTVVAVDVGGARGPADADRRLAVTPGHEVAVLTELAAAIAGAAPSASRRATDTKDEGVAKGTEVGAGEVGALARVVLGGRYVAIVAEAAAAPGADPGRSSALIALAQALNGPVRGALLLLRDGGNRSGADAVMTWQTGYPAAVDFARGVPRYRPYDGTAALRLARGEVDAMLVVGAPALVPAGLLGQMALVPHVAIGPRVSESALANGRAAIDTGVAGIHEAGLALRMDDVPVPLQAIVAGPRSPVAIVRSLSDRFPPAARLLSPGGKAL